MPIILRDLPFFVDKTTVFVNDRPVSIKGDQIIVWVGITEGQNSPFDSRLPYFPAILDTGNTHNFSIQEQHLIRWGGSDPRSLRNRGEIRFHGDPIPLLGAEVWIRPNKSGQRDEFLDRAPFRLAINSGIAVYPTLMSQAPRLPLLGLRALRTANLH